MLGNIKGLAVTLATFFRKPVTTQYPKHRKPIEMRFMGFPVLTWDEKVGEPYCTGCMVCVRYCPTECMTAVMKDNPLRAEGKSARRKIVDSFEINLGRCILCAICVDVCNFDAIEMSHEHELSKYARNGNRTDLEKLLEMGRAFQMEVGWKPAKESQQPGNETQEEEAVEAET